MAPLPKLFILLAATLGLLASFVQAQDDQGEKILISPEENKILQDIKEIRVGVRPAWAPYEFLDNNGRLQGITSDYVRIISRSLDKSVAPVPAKSWRDVLSMAYAGKVDVLMGVTKDFRLQRKFLFTKSYLSFPMVIVTRSNSRAYGSINDMDDKCAVAVIEGYGFQEKILQEKPGLLPLAFPNAETALKALSEGKADAYIGNLSVVNFYIRKLGLDNLQVTGQAKVGELKLHIAVRKDWPEMVKILNKVLNKITPDQKTTIIHRWISAHYVKGVELKVVRLWAFRAGLVVIAILIMFLIWNHILQRQISRRKKIEQELRQSENKFRKIIENSPVALLLTDLAGKIEYYNTRFIELYGYTLSDISEPEEWWERVYPDPEYRKLVRESWEIALEKSRETNSTIDPQVWEIVCKDGKKKTVEFQAVPVGDRYLVTMLDRTEQVVKEAELRKIETWLQEAQGLAKIGNWHVDMTKNDLWWSRELYRIMRRQFYQGPMSLPEYLGMIHPEDRETVSKTLLQIRKTGTSFNHEYRIQFPDDKVISVSEQGRCLKNDAGKVEEIFGTIQDITQRRLVEDELKLAKNRADQAANEAKQANKAKSEFLANISHEIRTPMNAILGYAEILEEQIENPRQQEFLRAINSSGKTLLAIINDILDLSKIESGKMELHFTSANLASLLDEIHQVFAQVIEDKNLKFSINLPPNLPKYLLIDEMRLRQVLINLLGNAVKFTETGEISISVSFSKLSDDPSSINLSIAVSDTGIGIAEDQLEEIFESFSQQTGQSQKRFGGTGLGLAISQRLVELMNGEITVESKTGKGSRFTVEIFEVPISTSHSENVPGISKNVMNHIKFAPAKILVADDVYENRKMLIEFLHIPELEVIEATNGQEAIEMVEIHRPDLILMDIKMPIMDGIEAAAKLKENPITAKIPIVGVTASITASQQEKYCRENFAACLVKPISKSSLIMEIKKYLNFAKDGKPQEKASGPAKKKKSGSGEISGSDLTKLKNELMKKFFSRWHEVSSRFFFDEIGKFASDVLATARKSKCSQVAYWAESLEKEVKNFNMRDVTGILNKFPVLIESLGEKNSETEGEK